MKQEHFFQSQRAADALSPAHTTDLPHTESNSQPSHDEVAKKAYSIYLNEGRPQGHALQNWLEAEAQTAASAEQQKE